jgi:site-specific recombinase XerD
MAGCRSLNDQEVAAVQAVLKTPRDRALFVLGLKSGLRIGSLLGLQVRDVFQGGKILPRVKVQRVLMKGKVKSFEIVLHPMAAAALLELVESLGALDPAADQTRPLFESRNGIAQPLSYFGARKILKDAYEAAGLVGQRGSLATHCMRKSFAKKVHAASGNDCNKVRLALGHSDMRNVTRYLEVTSSEVDAVVLAA